MGGGAYPAPRGRFRAAAVHSRPKAAPSRSLFAAQYRRFALLVPAASYLAKLSKVVPELAPELVLELVPKLVLEYVLLGTTNSL